MAEEIKIKEPSSLSEATELSASDELFVIHNGSTYTGTLEDIIKAVTKSTLDASSSLPVNTAAVNTALAAYTKDNDTLSTLNNSSKKPVNSSAVNGALADYGKSVISEGDLNNITAEGQYTIAWGCKLANEPMETSNERLLIVYRTLNGGGSYDYTWQEWRLRGNNVAYRRSQSGKDSWSAWEQVTTSSVLTSALAYVCRGLVLDRINADTTKTYNITKTGSYFIFARANASTSNTNPIINISYNGTIFATQQGATGGSVCTFESLECNNGDVISVSLQNITPNSKYNAVWLVLMQS